MAALAFEHRDLVDGVMVTSWFRERDAQVFEYYRRERLRGYAVMYKINSVARMARTERGIPGLNFLILTSIPRADVVPGNYLVMGFRSYPLNCEILSRVLFNKVVAAVKETPKYSICSVGSRVGRK
jgi:hypothetical protein